MPNHVKNYLTIHAEDSSLNHILDTIAEPKPDNWEHGDSQSDGTHLLWGRHTLDFNSIVPMPDDIYLGELDFEKRKLLAGKDWYTWCNANWGTKWNAYDYYKKAENSLTFCTAWSDVERLIKKLSQKFPGVIFEYSYFDEDFGARVGWTKWKNGKCLEAKRPNNFSKEAYELIFEMYIRSARDFELRFDVEKDMYVSVYGDE
jgi:hypothetical protein